MIRVQREPGKKNAKRKQIALGCAGSLRRCLEENVRHRETAQRHDILEARSRDSTEFRTTVTGKVFRKLLVAAKKITVDKEFLPSVDNVGVVPEPESSSSHSRQPASGP
jgi:hypothetical protein